MREPDITSTRKYWLDEEGFIERMVHEDSETKLTTAYKRYVSGYHSTEIVNQAGELVWYTEYHSNDAVAHHIDHNGHEQYYDDEYNRIDREEFFYRYDRMFD